MTILSKKLPFSKNHKSSYAHTLSKKHPFSQEQCSHIIFFKVFPVSCPYLVRERQFCQSYTILRAKKKIIGCLFVLNFHEKITAFMAIFCLKKLPFSKKHTALMPIFCQKNVHSLKNIVLSCHFFFFKFS